uniref:Uncharacterized protein n=1 Tax=Globodera rostochiensis TaxID=31243 RepID=A0A914H5K8_GLORO
MDGASNSNYGNKSKSIAVDGEQKYVLFKGFVQIGNRHATENEVVMEIFCVEKGFTGGIFTDSYGKFEVVMHASDVKALEKCNENELNIGFYRKNPNQIGNFVKDGVINPLDAKAKKQEREEEKKNNINESLNKQITKQDDENIFEICFNPNYAAINETKVLLDVKERYRTYSTNNYFFNSTEDSAKPETSSSEILVKKICKKVTTFFGKKEKKQNHF